MEEAQLALSPEAWEELEAKTGSIWVAVGSPFVSFVTLGELFNLFVPEFS